MDDKQEDEQYDLMGDIPEQLLDDLFTCTFNLTYSNIDTITVDENTRNVILNNSLYERCKKINPELNEKIIQSYVFSVMYLMMIL